MLQRRVTMETVRIAMDATICASQSTVEMEFYILHMKNVMMEIICHMTGVTLGAKSKADRKSCS